jgi:peptide/nickel transport system substrate-binding protein
VASHAVAAPEGQLPWAVHVSLAPAWFDPADTAGIITPFMFLYALHDALVKPMPGQALAPSLAESWTVSPDNLSYEFVLRRGVKFHNGDPVTAEDVKFSFDRYRGAGAGPFKARTAAVEVLDPYRVRFRFKEPWPDFMTFYGTPATGAGWIVPKKYVEKVGDDGFKRAPIGAGPYKFVSFNPGVELVLEAFDGYWRKTPSVKRLVFKSVSEEETRLVMLKRGEADIAYSIRGALAEEESGQEASQHHPDRQRRRRQRGHTARRLRGRRWDRTYGSYADIEGLIREQAGENDPKRREAMLQRIQQLIHDKAMVARSGSWRSSTATDRAWRSRASR